MAFVSDRSPQKPDLPVLPTPLTFDEFVAQYPDRSEFRYELRQGVMIQMPKLKGKHSILAGDLATDLNLEIRQRNLPYTVPKECVIKISDHTAYEPDVIVLDRNAIADEPCWESASTLERGTSVKLVIEIASTNWQDDYDLKMAEYESLGIPEYWIVDYAGFGGIRHIGKPKQPTLTVCLLIDGEYETRMFRGDETIESATFPGLTLTAAQILGL